MYCPECGVFIKKDVSYCPNCGKKIEHLDFINNSKLHESFKPKSYGDKFYKSKQSVNTRQSGAKGDSKPLTIGRVIRFAVIFIFLLILLSAFASFCVLIL